MITTLPSEKSDLEAMMRRRLQERNDDESGGDDDCNGDIFVMMIVMTMMVTVRCDGRRTKKPWFLEGEKSKGRTSGEKKMEG